MIYDRNTLPVNVSGVVFLKYCSEIVFHFCQEYLNALLYFIVLENTVLNANARCYLGFVLHGKDGLFGCKPAVHLAVHRGACHG